MAGRPKTRTLQERAKNPSDVGVGLLTAMAEQIPVEEVIDVVRGLLTATTTVRTGRETSQEIPDHRAREAGAKIYCGYQLGLPLQRSIEIKRIEEPDQQVMERMLASPATRRALRKALDRADPVKMETVSD